MASTNLKIHRLGLDRLVVEGKLQSIVRIATLTLKDENSEKLIMQVHVDGHTLAQWDLVTLRERKLLAQKFFSITEQKMLQLTLPLFELDGQKVATWKTIQLFILTVKDFHTAVDYLSSNAGMQHCRINEVLQDVRGANIPVPVSRPQESVGMSQMRPPTAPLMGRPMRPQSQTSVYPPVMHSPLQPVYRSQTTRPSTTSGSGIFSENPSASGPFVPFDRRPSSQEHRHLSNPNVGPTDSRSSFVPSDLSHPRRMLSMGPGVDSFRERRSMYNDLAHLDFVDSHTPSHPMRPDAWGPPPSNRRVGADLGNVPDGPYHNRFPGQAGSKSGQILPLVHHTISTTTYPFERHLLSKSLTSRPTSRSSTLSDHGLPIRIQVLGLPNAHNYSSLHPKVRWEFTLPLLPETKIWQLCLHAASYIRREYCASVDGRTLAAQSMEGTPFESQDSLSDEILQGGTLRLLECKPSRAAQSLPANSKPLHLGRGIEVPRLDGAHPQSPPNPFPHGIDEGDCVPPPRQLPFRVVNTPAPPGPSSSNPTTRPPLSERKDLTNADPRSLPNQKSAQTVDQETRKRAVSSEQPNSAQTHPIATTRRPASVASGSKVNSARRTAIPSRPHISGKQTESSLGIRRKRKAPSRDAEVSAAVLPIVDKSSVNEQATRSCMGCRNKKRKCDRSKPACGPCLKDKRPCTYPNTPEEATAAHSPKKARNRPGPHTDSHLMILRGQALASPPILSDASAQTNHVTMFRDIGSQTQEIVHDNRDVEMKDVGTDPSNLYTDACTETDRSDDLWVPFSQCAQLVLWASDQYRRKVQQAADILRTTDPSQDDYKDRVAQAAVYAGEFMNEFREKYAPTLEG